LVLIGSINGVFAQFLFADSPMVSDKLTSLGNALVFISASLFYDKVMHIRRVSSPYIWLLTRATLMFFIIIPVSLALGLFTEWMALAINAILFAIVLWLLRALQLWYTQNGSLLLVFSHVWTLFGGLASALALSGFLDPDFWLLNGFQIGMLGTILSLQLLMIQRVIKLDKARISAVAKAQATRESLQQQESMLSMLTHELKTPLSVISMSLQSKAPSDRLKEHAFNAIGNITDVIDRCVHSQKLKHESHPLNIADVDVVSLIGRVVAVKEGSKEIRVMHTLTSPIIRTDEIYMNLIVTNLLDNALKYGKDGEPITIDVTQSMNGICMSVSNVVAEDSLPNADKMFERFYRAPTAYKVSGAGLGLFIVKSLTEAISGKIDYKVLDAHKVAFYVCLPQNLQEIKLKDESK
jgi:signal transduction histidine kinase